MMQFVKGKVIYNNEKCKEGMILHKIKRGKTDWIGYILRINCLLSRTVEGKKEGDVEGTGRRGRRCRELLNNFKKMRRRWKLKEKVLCVISLHHTPRRTRFGRRTQLWTCRQTYCVIVMCQELV